MGSYKIMKLSDRAIANEKGAADDDDGDKEDIISSLPNSLLIHILSFLDATKEIVKTCVLSKRWEFVWTDLLEVNLTNLFYNSGDRTFRKPVECVGKIFANCKSLKKFAILFPYRNCFVSDVNHWLYLATTKHKIKDITLQFETCSRSVYELPQMLYSYSSLSKLNVKYCVMAPPLGIIAWRSLESLTISRVELLDSLLENILSSCPLLKMLHLQLCWGFNYLNINSPNLTTLRISYPAYTDKNIVDISAPYLRVLYIWFSAPERKFRFTNISSVVEATIFVSCCFSGEMIIMNTMKQLLESLQSVEILELGSQCLEVITALEYVGWNVPSYTKLWSLTLKAVSAHEMRIPCILTLLRSSPNLRTLFIKPRNYRYPERKQELAQYAICDKDCNMDLVASHLKTVEIDEFPESEGLLTLVQILLKCSKVLEKMVISFDTPTYLNSSIDCTELVQKVLTFPKESPKGVVVLRKCSFSSTTSIDSTELAQRILTFPKEWPKGVVVLRKRNFGKR